MSIDTSNIRAGDYVEGTYQTEVMRKAGVGPATFGGEVYPWSGSLWVADKRVGSQDLIITKHTPKGPDWTKHALVQDGDNDLWVNLGDGTFEMCLYQGRVANHSAPEPFSYTTLQDDFGPIKTVLVSLTSPLFSESKSEGRLPGWEIELLPPRSLILVEGETIPKQRNFAGEWRCLLGVFPSLEFPKDATLLWNAADAKVGE